MFPLDARTLERIARLAVDAEGPTERRGFQLAQLLRHAGWQNPPDYDGSPRVAWFVDAMTDVAEDRDATERLLRRLCDPVEYDGGMPVATAVREELNRILEPERLVVTYLGGRPVVGELESDDSTLPRMSAPDNIADRLKALIADESVVEVLTARVVQSHAAEEAGAYLLAIFGIGSFVEGLLFSTVTEKFPDTLSSGFLDRNGRRVMAKAAGMALLVEVAHDAGLIQLDAKDFVGPVREFRNYIHPRLQLERAFEPDRDTVMMSWAPVHAILNDLEAGS